MSQISGTSYILTFFLDIKELGDSLSAYNNALLLLDTAKQQLGLNEKDQWTNELSNKAIEKKLLDQNQINGITTIANRVRYWTIQIYLKFMGLEEKIPQIKKEKENLKKLSREIQKSQLPNYEDVEKFCILANQIFATSALTELLIKDQNYFSQLSQFNKQTEDEDVA